MKAMLVKFALGIVLTTVTFISNAQIFGNGPKIDTMREFDDGKFQFTTRFDLAWYHVVKWRDPSDPHVARVADIAGRARLFLPKDTREKAPAIVLIHHSGGLYFPDGRARPNFLEWADALTEAGIAVVLLDVYSPRQMNRTANQSRRYNWDAVFDAFRVRELLQTHPKIDPNKIGIGGMSMGGTAALFAFDERVSGSWSADGRPFAFNIAVYPTCGNQFHTWKPVKAPLLIMKGELDEYAGVDACYELEMKLQGLSANVTSITYKGAYHSWDEDYSPRPANDRSNKNCRWWMMDGGGWRTPSGELLDTDAKATAFYNSCSIADPALTMVGRNEAAFRKSKADMVEFIKRVTR